MREALGLLLFVSFIFLAYLELELQKIRIEIQKQQGDKQWQILKQHTR